MIWFVLTLVLIPLIYLAGHWAVGHYLGRDIKVGTGSLRLVNARWRWSLELRADSLLYHAPGMTARGGATAVTANLFRSLWRFSPSVDFTLDTLRLALHPADEAKPKAKRPARDSLPFPDFKLPVSVRVEVGRVRVEDDSGFLAEADGITAATGGPRSASLEVRSLGARALHGLAPSLKTSMEWPGDNLHARLEIARGLDSVAVVASGPKADLLRAQADVGIRMASSAPYAQAFKAPSSLPLVQDLRFSLQAAQGTGYRVHSNFTADISGFDPRAAYRIGPQKMDGSLDFRDTSGTWSLRSRGPKGEDLALEGGLRTLALDSLANAAWLARHLEVSLRGYARNIRIATAGKILPANVQVKAPRMGPDALVAEIATGDGSRLSADLRKTASGWAGPFSLSIPPEEPWVRAFADTNVRFRSLQAKGRAEGRRVGLDAVVSGLRAFGAEADSIHLMARYGPDGIVLSPSYWHRKGVVWRLTGRMSMDSASRKADFTLWHPDFGSAEASLRSDRIEARLRGLAIYTLPYRGLDSLAARKPKMSASFAWDTSAHTGRADARVTGNYRSEPLEANARAEWDRRSLRVTELDASLGGNSLRGGGEVALHGRQFHQLAAVNREDIRHVFLQADRFDLAKALRIASAHPPLLSGSLDGRLDYSDSGGFRGAYHARDLQPAATNGTLKAREIALLGNGDSLIIRAVTQSEKEPLFADSLELGLGGVLRAEQVVSLKVAVGRKLFLRVSGRMRAYADFRGNVSLRGDAALPGKSGEILGLDAYGPFAVVFREGPAGWKMDLDTLRGRYAVPGLDTQSFSAPLHIVRGRLSIPDLSMKGKSGSLGGTAAMDLGDAHALTAHLQGDGLLAQLGPGDKIRLKDLRIDLRSDTSKLELQARLGSGSIEHVKSPLRAAADFSRLNFTYRAPKTEPAGGVYSQSDFAFLEASARLDSSNVKYRLRSFETLQNLFKRKPQARGARPARPMEIRLDLETAGSGNRVETDVLRFAYVGNFSMRGTYPYALVQGRINSTEGQLGTKAQAYDLSRMEIKWLNSTLEEGHLDLEARKKLAKDCEAGTTDSCTVINRLAGPLSQTEFSYDTDCGGAYGAGADVAALVYSVRRGCYSSAFAGGGSGLSYQEQALALLEPLASDYLSRASRKLSGHWIAQTKITGLGSLASNQGSSSDTATEALALEVISKEFWRTRLSLRSYYRPQETENNDPWAYRMALEWRPPLARLVRDPQWKKRLKNNVSLDASVYTDTAGTMDPNQERIGQRLGLNYDYRFWVRRWSKPESMRELLQEQAADTAGERRAARDSE
ncbi:MAG: translocation/assembly module TamB domain-containing protein [Fibrobacteres bacterium]|nr:translocation/assembly module TamB domain-containing protein [Fibrobacterota bacterium]